MSCPRSDLSQDDSPDSSDSLALARAHFESGLLILATVNAGRVQEVAKQISALVNKLP